MSREAIFESVAIAATIAIGIICEAIGIHMLYKGTIVTIGKVSFSAAPVLLIMGLVLIVAGLNAFSKTRRVISVLGTPYFFADGERQER